MREIEEDFFANDDVVWDVFPGEDMLTCFLNCPDNYEDSMMVSSRFADMGGFFILSICTCRISDREAMLPKVGDKLCRRNHKWWKVDCTSTCICKMNQTNNRLASASRRVPWGTVREVMRMEDGRISTKC